MVILTGKINLEGLSTFMTHPAAAEILKGKINLEGLSTFMAHPAAAECDCSDMGPAQN